MSVKVPDLGVFFDIVSASILDGDTGLLVESLSGGNIRRGLSLAARGRNTFFLCGLRNE